LRVSSACRRSARVAGIDRHVEQGLASCEASIWALPPALGIELTRSARRASAEKFCDVEHGGVDVDIARLQRLAAGSASRCWISSLQRSAAGRSSSAVFCSAGSCARPATSVSVVPVIPSKKAEVVRDAAGGLPMASSFAIAAACARFRAGGGVVIDQRRTADGARGIRNGRPLIMRWTGGLPLTGRTTISVTSNASPRSARGGMPGPAARDAVGMKDGAERAQQFDRHARPERSISRQQG
jgi:hypothetical protein